MSDKRIKHVDRELLESDDRRVNYSMNMMLLWSEPTTTKPDIVLIIGVVVGVVVVVLVIIAIIFIIIFLRRRKQRSHNSLPLCLSVCLSLSLCFCKQFLSAWLWCSKLNICRRWVLIMTLSSYLILQCRWLQSQSLVWIFTVSTTATDNSQPVTITDTVLHSS